VISQAISFPLYSYARSNTLKVKLERLSSLPPSPLFYSLPTLSPEKSHPLSQDHGTSSAIYTVVQARLWRIMQRGLYDPDAARRLKPMKLVSRHESESLGRPSDEMILEDDITLYLESSHGGSSSAPETLGEFGNGNMLADPLGFSEDDLLLVRSNELTSFRHRPYNTENCYHQSTNKERNSLLGSDGGGNGMLAIEVQPIVDENHELLYETKLFSTYESGFPQVFEEDELYLTEDGDWPTIGDMYKPICEADLFDTHEPGVFAGSNSFQGVHKEEGEESQLVLTEEDILAMEALVHDPGQQYDLVEEDEMLF
jgi:hypothetical protein